MKRFVLIEIEVPEVGDACWTHPEGGAIQCFHDVVLTPALMFLSRQMALNANPALEPYLEKKSRVLNSVKVHHHEV